MDSSSASAAPAVPGTPAPRAGNTEPDDSTGPLREPGHATVTDASERRYLLLRESLRDAFVEVAMDGRLVDCNEQFCEMLGYDATEVLTLTYLDLTPAAWHEFEDRIVREQIVPRGYSDVYEKEYRRKDGTVFPVELRTILSREADGRPHTMWATVRDITTRRAAEAARRESEARFRSVLEQSRDVIYRFNTRTQRYDYVSPSASAVLGISAEWLMERDDGLMLQMVHPDDRQAVVEALSAVFTRGQVEVEYRQRTGQDEYRWLSNRMALEVGADGRPLYRSGNIRDVTERRRAEEAARESERRARQLADELQAILDVLPAAVFITHDAEGRRIEGNVFAERLLRAPRHANLSVSAPGPERPRQFTTLMNGVEVTPNSLPVQAAVRAGVEVRDCELDLVFEDGAVSLFGSAVPLRGDDGRVRGAVGAFVNVTQRKAAEAALLEADRRKSEFLAILSHELRNPLAPIRYAVPVLQRERLSETGARVVAIVERQVGQLTRHVDDLLDVTRIVSDKIELRREHVTLASVLTTAIEAASPAIAVGLHTITTNVPDEPIWLHLDPSRVSQVVTNLLDNAAKYTPHGGHVRLDACREGEFAVIRVSDNGVGIPPEELGTIFEMFHQVKRVDRTAGGLGIGLALVRRLVELQGGTVEARSAGAGCGSEFTVRLPLAREAAGTAGTPARATGSGRTLKVLVVDDNVDLVDLLAQSVSMLGHDVRKAFDGRSAVSAARLFSPDVVLLDLGLPVMDGFEVARWLRSMPETAGCHLVALTGWGQGDDRRRSREAGFDTHLTKPADPDALERLLSRVGGDGPA